MPDPRYLLVRPEDLVVLVGTVPPQAVAESKDLGGGGVRPARLSGAGTVVLALDDGAAIPLTVDGLLARTTAGPARRSRTRPSAGPRARAPSSG